MMTVNNEQMIETLKSSLLFNFRTGDVMLDTLITGMIVVLASSLYNFFQNNFDANVLKRIYESFKPYNSKITICGRRVHNENYNRLEYSTNFFAVLHRIRNLDFEESRINTLGEIPIEDPAQVSYRYNSHNDDNKQPRGVATNLIVSQTGNFILDRDVMGAVNFTTNQVENEAEDGNFNRMTDAVQTDEFSISLTSDTLGCDELRERLNTWCADYKRMLNKDNETALKYYLYYPKQNHSDNDDCSYNYEEFKFESGKSFKNIFYPNKDKIIRRLDFFANNKQWYKTRGIPYTLGFMFYGEPGCGKTSTIKAMANHTKRHIVSVPLNRITSLKELLDIFYSTNMNGKNIPLTKRLYILEDIDGADLRDVVADREELTPIEGPTNNIDKKKNDDFDLLAILKSSIKSASKLTLASLLEVLDGVMEMEGRMMIITTNYPERLDKALIRPGRVDMKMKFGLMQREDVVNMYSFYFDHEVPKEFIDRIPDCTYTPAETMQVFLNHMWKPMDALVKLCSCDESSDT